MLFIERTAMDLNPRQALLRDTRALDYIIEAGLTDVLDLFYERLETAPHALYEVRRFARFSSSAKKPTFPRSVRALDRGSRREMVSLLSAMPGTPTADEYGTIRHYLRNDPDPARIEHFYAVAPAGILDKEIPRFSELWEGVAGSGLFDMRTSVDAV